MQAVLDTEDVVLVVGNWCTVLDSNKVTALRARVN